MSFFPSNSQIQTQNADSRFQATVLVGAPSFPDAIAWSDENLIAVASGHLVTILNPAALPFGPRGLITIKNSRPFPIGVIDRQDLFSNCMLPTILSRDQEPCVRSISWSPVGLAPNAGCLLAVCTTQGFVKLYRSPYCDFCAEWIEVANISAKHYDYLVSINFGEVRASSSKLQDVNEHEIEPEIDYDPSKQKSSNKIVRASKSKVKPAKEIPENSTLPLITADQYASHIAMLSSLVVAWSPMLHSLSKICSVPQDGSSMSLLAVGGKSGKVSVWRIPVPECYFIDQSRVPATVVLIGMLQAHNSWITAIDWVLLDCDSSNPKVLLATASTDGSVRIWMGNNEKLLKSSEPSDTSFSLLKEVASDAAPVFVLSVIVPTKSPDKIHLAVGKGSGSFELWICNISSQNFDKIGTYDAHGQTVTGLAWAFDGQSLYSCSQDNVVRCWILNGSSLCEVPIPSNIPRLRNSTDLPEEFVSCFGLAVSPGNLVIAWVRNTDVEQLNPMYEARTQKAIVEFFWSGGQQVDVLPNNSLHFDIEVIPGFSEELVYWESNFLWSLKQYEMQDKPLVVWDIVTALLAFNHSKPEFVEEVLIKWLSISYLGSQAGIPAETVLLNVSRSCSIVTSRQLHLLNIICRRVILSEMKADEINSKLLNLKGVLGAEKEKRSLWINLLLNSEKELRERLVGFTFSALLSQMPTSAPNSPSGKWFPVGLAQMEQWIELNHDHVHGQLKVLASEVGKRDRRFKSSKCTAAETCSYCLTSFPFESPELAICSGKGHKLVRCSISMEICPTTPTWFCTCCHRRASKPAPATLFATPGLPLNFKSLAASPLLDVARVLHLIYRLVVQPNKSRAQMFAEAFIDSGGIETLLVLLQREAKAGDYTIPDSMTKEDENFSVQGPEPDSNTDVYEQVQDDEPSEGNELNLHEKIGESTPGRGSSPVAVSPDLKIGRMTSAAESTFTKNLGGIALSIGADNARNNVYNIDKSDGVLVGIISLLGAVVASGYLKFGSRASLDMANTVLGSALNDGGGTMFEDKVSLLLFALQKAIQAAPNRLLTSNVYTALLGASINASSSDDGLNFYDSGHQFEHMQLLLVLLRSLPYASKALQSRALQDLLFLACSHSENRSGLTQMEGWPEWILEDLISNYEMGASKHSNSASSGDVEDLIHNFLCIMLEHSMRQKDGWKDIEATIHCAEWLSIVGGSSTGDQRVRREESLPIFKRRLLGGLLDFAARELQLQTQVIAAASANVAAEGLSPSDAKAEAENAAQLSVALVENAIVILMLVEDHLRLQSKLSCASRAPDSSPSPLSLVSPMNNHSNLLSTVVEDSIGASGDRKSLSNDSGLPLDLLASMADANGQISAAVMERLTAAAAAEPYGSVSCAFVSYGSCVMDLAVGWKYRSRLWYGVGHPSNTEAFGGGGSGRESWMSALEKDANGNWIELPLVKKSVAMLQALLLDDSGLGGGLGIGGGSGTGMGGMAALYQLLDSDQPFLCMLRMALLSMREEDDGEDNLLMRNVSIDDVKSEGRQPRSALLWSVLSPVLNMAISDSKRQRVLVASCVLYSELYHAVGRDRKPLRKKYLEAIVPPFVAVLRRWRPLLAGIHELATADGFNPLTVEDRALAADALPIEAALALISPAWAAAFASPPAAMALAMIAAGASGGETPAPTTTSHLRRDSSLLERKTTKLHTFSSFQKPLELPNKLPALPKDKAAAKAAALAAARDLERNAKIGSGRGLSAVAMATSAQRRSASDMERVKRWNVSEAMGVAWMECLQPVDTKSVYGKDFNALSYTFIAVLVASFALARNIQRSEVDRRSQVDLISRHRLGNGVRAWRKLIHCLIEMKCLFGPSGDQLCKPAPVFWKLDFMESSTRMRRCVRRNYKGSDHFGAAANFEDHNKMKERENGIHSSNAPILAAEAIAVEAVNEDDEQGEIDNLDGRTPSEEQSGENQPHLSETAEQSLQSTMEFGDAQVSCEPDLGESSSAVAPGYVPSELDERIVLELPSSMVRPLRVIRGTFQVTSRRINFIVDNSEANGAVDGSDCTEMKDQEKDRSWTMSSLHQIYSRRYLLRRSALELFMVDRSNFFFDFGSTDGRRNAYRAIVQARPPHLNNIYLATQRPEQLLKRTQLMERWARWEISNFEYLMQLNTLAGRSYNDITQYPVFPWILSDYSSKRLDLADPSSYRDLSKPVGALNADRLEKFHERYSSFEDPVIPKFHYGSHYSSAGTVLYYLVRVEPFTTLSIQLQGGKFDHADRMFSDIAATWNGVTEDMSDVKELVPELFYLPEMLTNENSIDFGITQTGGLLDSVKIPPWAENPIDFIHKHRKALESEHVSAHLHEWIDLIFGYKQRGKEAIIANNVFFYITYEGTVDIDKILDPVQQRATQDQIAYFGQTPSQLLTIPHLKRLPLADVLHLQTIFRNPKEVKPYAVSAPERCNLPAAAIHASSDAIIIANVNAPAANVAEHKWQPNTPDGQGMPFLFQHGKATAGSTGGTFIRMFKGPAGSSSDEWQFPQALAFAASGITSSAIVAITCDKEIITGGHVDNSIKLISSDGAKTLETAFGHCAPVTCLGLSPDSNYLVTGSRDTTVLLWRIHRASTSRSSSISEPSGGTGTPGTINGNNLSHILADKSRRRRIEGPIHVLRGHQREILCCCVSSDLGIVVSCSQSSDVLLHSTRRGRLIRRLPGGEAHAVCLSSEGIVLTWNKTLNTLNTFTLNGVPIGRAQLPFSGSISCMEISVDGWSALIGINTSLENNGWDLKLKNTEFEDQNSDKAEELDVPSPSICFLDLHTLKVFHVLKLGLGQDIISLALNTDNTNLLVSTVDKQLIIFTDPALSLKVVDHMLKLGWEGGGLSPLIKS